MINEMGDWNELECRFKRQDHLIQKHEEDEEFQDHVKFQLIQKSSGVPCMSQKNKWEAHLNENMEILFSIRICS